ncbi:MAG: PadR family transcriptional regulator [Gemmatimonadaceae bacterium]
MDKNLGELEQLVLFALLRLGDDAYGVTVHQEILERTGRTMSFATIYTTLSRLESKGMVDSFVGDPTPERGGRAKKHFAMTSNGKLALQQSVRALRSMSRGLDTKWGTP